jgi:ketosteroid isomerase-like protein
LIINAEHALVKAHVDLDIATIDSLLHEDYVILQQGGKIETKPDVIDSYNSGLRHWEKAKVADLDVNVYGDMGRVIGLWKAAGTNNGIAFDYRARFISVWIQEGDNWKNIFLLKVKK